MVKLVAMCLVFGGCVLPWNDSSTEDTGAGPLGPSGGYTTPPSVPSPTFEARGIDHDLAPAFGTAVGGHDVILYDSQGATSIDVGTTGAFALVHGTSDFAEVIAQAAGDGSVELTATYAAGRSQTSEPLSAVAVSTVAAGIPGYHPQGAMPTTFLGPSFSGDVRLLDADGDDLRDTSLAIAGAGVTASSWDTFDAAGATTLELTGGSIGQMTLPLAIALHFDRVELVDSGDDPPATYYHTVCAHGFAGTAEVAATWSLVAPGAFASYTTEAPRRGNCLSVIPADGGTTITATAPDGETATLAIAP